MKTFAVPCVVTFVVVYALSFTVIGELLLIAQLLVVDEDGVNWNILLLIGAMFGTPFLGYLGIVFDPGKEGRKDGFLSITGFWVGLGLALFAVNMRLEGAT